MVGFSYKETVFSMKTYIVKGKLSQVTMRTSLAYRTETKLRTMFRITIKHKQMNLLQLNVYSQYQWHNSIHKQITKLAES